MHFNLIPSFCILLSMANAIHLKRYDEPPYNFQAMQSQVVQLQSIKEQPKRSQITQRQEPHGKPKCSSCIININCGDADCLSTALPHTEQSTVWTLPPIDVSPTQTPPSTYVTNPVPESTSEDCMFPCCIPATCEICQPCQ